MMMGFSIMASLLLAGIAFLFAKIKLTVKSVDGRKNFFCLKLCLWGLPVYRAVLYLRIKKHICPVIVKVRRGRRFAVLFRWKWGKKAAKKGRKQNPWVKSMLKAAKVSRFALAGSLAFGDAAGTALACGTLSAAGQLALRFLGMPVESCNIAIAPDFSGEELAFTYTFLGIISVGIADIIRIYIKEERGGKEYAPN
ncbi:MAG: DUF2953 domain-containing protein [Christensenellaceae bacterium]|nr:DUF2953 domain-containing protein [Christensenellaceae bacterium]